MPTCNPVFKLMNAPIDPTVPAEFAFVSLLSPNVFPVNTIPPFFMFVYRNRIAIFFTSKKLHNAAATLMTKHYVIIQTRTNTFYALTIKFR